MLNAKLLFDDIERSDDAPLRAGESPFGFLNRSAWPRNPNVRSELERWYKRFPDSNGDLRSRFRRKDQNHESAFFELFLHELFVRLGLSVEVNPTLAGGSKPDFLVAGSGSRAYVEATVVADTIGDSPLEAPVFEAINRLDGEVPAGWGVSIDTEGTLERAPRLPSITRKIRSWLNDLEPAAPTWKNFDSSTAPRLEVSADPACGDWVVRAKAVPRSAGGSVIQARHFGGSGTLGGPVRDAISTKARQLETHGDLLIVAVNDGSGYGTRHEAAALFGPVTIGIPSGEILPPTGGIWTGKRTDEPWNPTHAEISAVMIFRRASPYTAASVEACLYLNPYLEDRIPEELRAFGYAAAEGDDVKWHAGTSTGQILSLEDDWPGPFPPQAFRGGT